jgi:hypothetical protein
MYFVIYFEVLRRDCQYHHQANPGKAAFSKRNINPGAVLKYKRRIAALRGERDNCRIVLKGV